MAYTVMGDAFFAHVVMVCIVVIYVDMVDVVMAYMFMA